MSIEDLEPRERGLRPGTLRERSRSAGIEEWDVEGVAGKRENEGDAGTVAGGELAGRKGVVRAEAVSLCVQHE
jgi:hypothetical protein